MSWRQWVMLAGVFVLAALLLAAVLAHLPEWLTWSIFGLFCVYEVTFWERERRGKGKDGRV